MRNDNVLPKQLDSLARTLRDLEPTPSRIDRDRLMFLAGEAVGQTSGGPGACDTVETVNLNRARGARWKLNTWRGLAALSTTAAAALAALYIAERSDTARSLPASGTAPLVVVKDPGRDNSAAPQRPCTSQGKRQTLARHLHRDPVADFLALPGLTIRGGLDRDRENSTLTILRNETRRETASGLMRELLELDEGMGNKS